LSQDYTDNIEIIIVDGMSTDNTHEIIMDYQINHPQIRLINNPGRIVPIGMNIALREAKGDIILRVDGHCIIASDYLRRTQQLLLERGIDGVGGPIETIGENRVSQTIAIAMSSIFGVGNSAFRISPKKTMFVDTIPFPAFTREMIRKAGLYDEELVRDQDDEYNYRIREVGGKLLLACDLQSKYFSRGSIIKLWKQYFQYGYWKVRVLQKHPRQMSLRQFIPPLFVFSLLASIVLTFCTIWGWWFLLLSGGSYLFVNVVVSILTASKKGWKHLALLPITFLIIHLSYGLGFLIGLTKFWNRWSDKTGKVPQF
jgi:glycosyltransferase involved in cell wall biosynthesis